MKRQSVSTEFVQHVPERIEEGVLYVSIEYATVVHKCFCGCGKEVVTPLSPTDWTLSFDGETASLDPSVGNWSFPCRSHYWIRRNRVRWAGDMPQELIDAGRARERRLKHAYYAAREPQQNVLCAPKTEDQPRETVDASVQPRKGWLSGLIAWASGTQD